MRKTKLFKRSAAVVISASMVLTSVNVIPELKEEAKAADAVTPVFSMDFSGTMESDGNYTENGNIFKSKNAEIVDGKLHIKSGGMTDLNSNSYLKSEKIFSNMDFSKGITVQLDYKSEVQGIDWSNVFSLGEVADNNFIGAAIGTITKVGSTNNTPAGSWNISTSVLYKNYKGDFKDNPWDYFKLDAHKDEEHTFTYSYSTTGVNFYVDGLLSNSWSISDPSTIYNNLKDGHFAIATMPDDKLESCNGTYDNIKIYDKACTAAEVYKGVTGKDRLADATELETSISAASKYTRSELYKEDSYKTLTEKLAAANAVDGNPMSTADEILNAKTELDAAIVALERTASDVTSDIILNTDMTSNTSLISSDNKSLYSNGNKVSAIGDATISSDGYISTPGTSNNDSAEDNGTQGVKIDASALKNVSEDKGLTINALVSIDDISKTEGWSDIISLYTSDDKYTSRVTPNIGVLIPSGVYGWPHGNYTEGTYGLQSNLYNGAAWDSYKTKFAKADSKVAVTMTVDKQYMSVYFDGVLYDKYDYTKYVDSTGAEAKDADGNTGYANTLKDILANTSYITVFSTKDSTPERNDIAGKVYGVQVYGRALDAAEVDTLVTSGTTASPKGITFKNQAADATISVKDANGTEVATAVCGTDGSAVVHGLTTGQTYTFTIKNGETWTREGSITVDADKVIDGWAATGVKFKEETLELKNSKIKATGEVKNDVKNLPALVLDPENTSEKIEDCKISYASDKEEVAKVSEDGKVTAVADGEANITATVVTPSGKTLTAVCKVKVSTTEVTDIATAVKLDKETASIEVGKTLQLKAEVTPGTALQHGTWKSSNEAVAKVNEAGLVTAVAAGEAEITFTTADGTNLSAKCKVTVTAKAEPTVAPSATPAPGTSTEPTAKPSATPTAKPTVAPTKKPSNTKKPAKKLKSATITVKNGKKKVSSVTVKTKKSVKLSVSVNSKAKLSVAKLSKKNAKIAKVTFKKNKLTIKGLKKGKVSIKITSKKTSKYKAATKTIKVTVKK